MNFLVCVEGMEDREGEGTRRNKSYPGSESVGFLLVVLSTLRKNNKHIN